MIFSASFEQDGLHLRAVSDENGKLLPTRWGGKRCLGYILTNNLASTCNLKFPADSFSGHKALSFKHDAAHELEYDVGRLSRTKNLAYDSSLDWDVWASACDNWASENLFLELPAKSPMTSQVAIDD